MTRQKTAKIIWFLNFLLVLHCAIPRAMDVTEVIICNGPTSE